MEWSAAPADLGAVLCYSLTRALRENRLWQTAESKVRPAVGKGLEMADTAPITIEQILAAAPLCAAHLSPDHLTELAPKVQSVLTALARLDDLDLSAYEPCLTLRLAPEEA